MIYWQQRNKIDYVCIGMTSYCSSLSWKTKLARCLIPLRLVWQDGQWEYPDCLCQTQRKTPNYEIHAAGCSMLAAPPAQPARWITGAACNPKPWVSPAAVDTMQDAKLFSILDCRTCVCLLRLSFSFSDPFQKFASLLAPLFCHAAVYCYQTLAISGEKNAAITQPKKGRKMYESLLFWEIERQICFVVSWYCPERSSCSCGFLRLMRLSGITRERDVG